MKKNKILSSLIGALAIVSISFAGANVIGNYTVKQNITMDTVDISISEKMHKENELVDFNFNDFIVPTQEVEKVTSVQNKGVECYIRMKIEIFRSNQKIRNVNTEEIINFNDDFVYCEDGYYYLNSSLNENEIIQLFDGIIMPSKELHMIKDDEEDIEKNINFVMSVDAIQTRGFEQNLTSKSPWKGVAVQKTLKSRMEGEVR